MPNNTKKTFLWTLFLLSLLLGSEGCKNPPITGSGENTGPTTTAKPDQQTPLPKKDKKAPKEILVTLLEEMYAENEGKAGSFSAHLEKYPAFKAVFNSVKKDPTKLNEDKGHPGSFLHYLANYAPDFLTESRLKSLKAAGANLTQKSSYRGETPLHMLAPSSNYTPALRALINVAGKEALKIPDEDGATPLNRMAMTCKEDDRHHEIVEILAKSGSKDVFRITLAIRHYTEYRANTWLPKQ